ncbi:MAG: dUTP diphosphatase [Bacillota bacterium]|nr:dUTP diphosphatase [Bacillota bacterium]
MDKSCLNCKNIDSKECPECFKQDDYINWDLKINPIPVKLINTDDPQFMPSRKHPEDAGADLRARIDHNIVLFPNDSAKIPTGIAMEIPSGYLGDIRPRSGAAHEGKLTISGTIDSNYRGEISLNVVNITSKTITIVPGERLAQIVILPYLVADFEQVDELSESDRGTNGFGSTGRV